ncbi:signal transducer and activator of transcription C-like [Hydra vulgaris]|uniref:Signal transducer and activator of transcription C-like n=1 Tax=Hydra vulgaris TaxID=6087 RepID=A0ABM4D905_HYDVU
MIESNFNPDLLENNFVYHDNNDDDHDDYKPRIHVAIETEKREKIPDKFVLVNSTQKRSMIDEEILVPARAENNPGIRHEINSVERSQKRDKILKLNKRSIWDTENPVARTTVLGKKAEMNPILQMLRAAAGQKTQKILGLNSKAFDIFPGPMPEERETSNSLEGASVTSEQNMDFSSAAQTNHHRRANLRNKFNSRSPSPAMYETMPQVFEMNKATSEQFNEANGPIEGTVPEQSLIKEYEGHNNGYNFQNPMQKHHSQMFIGTPNFANPINFFRSQNTIFQRPQRQFTDQYQTQTHHESTQLRNVFPEMKNQFDSFSRGIQNQQPFPSQNIPFENFNNQESDRDATYQQEYMQGQQNDDYLNQIKEFPYQERLAQEAASKAMMDDQDQEQERQMNLGRAIHEQQEAEFIQQQKISEAMREISNQQQQQQENELKVRHQLPTPYFLNKLLRFPSLSSNDVINTDKYHNWRELNNLQAIKKQYTEPEPIYSTNGNKNSAYFQQAVAKQQTHPFVGYEHNKSLLPIGPVSAFSSVNDEDEDEEKPEVHVHISTEKSRIAKPIKYLSHKKW